MNYFSYILDCLIRITQLKLTVLIDSLTVLVEHIDDHLDCFQSY